MHGILLSCMGRCWYVRLLVLHLLYLWNPWLLIKIGITLVYLFYIYFYRCLVDVHLNWLKWFPLYYSWGRSTRYSDRLHNFSVTIPRYCKDVYVNSFFPLPAKLWNSLLIECFSLTYDLLRNGLVVKVLDSQSRAPVFKISGRLQGWLSFSSFRVQWNEYQEFLGTEW